MDREPNREVYKRLLEERISAIQRTQADLQTEQDTLMAEYYALQLPVGAISVVETPPKVKRMYRRKVKRAKPIARRKRTMKATQRGRKFRLNLKTRKRVPKPMHWTQRPENAHKVKALGRKRWAHKHKAHDVEQPEPARLAIELEPSETSER